MRGVAASFGIAVGKVIIKPEVSPVSKELARDTGPELSRLEECLSRARKLVVALAARHHAEVGHEGASIFEAQLMILNDPDFHARVEERIRKKSANACWAVERTVEDFARIFESMEDPYLIARAADVREIGEQLLLLLQNQEPFNPKDISEPSILVAHDLTPAEMGHIREGNIVGIITETGGPTTHAAILARSMEIPAVVGAGPLFDKLSEGDIVAMDGHTGEFHLSPDPGILKVFTERMNSENLIRARLEYLTGVPTLTADGHVIELTCNIGSPLDLEAVRRNDGESVGLYRTEYLYMDRDSAPDEEEQYEAYSAIVKAYSDKAVTIRTLDIGGDKRLPYLQLQEEQNPFLGFRSLRYCLEARDLFLTQLRALARASAHGRLKIMFPMVATLEELRRAKAMLQEAVEHVQRRGLPVAERIEVGILIEVPSAAMISDILAREVDFFSIGTNDLYQYTLSADRTNPKLAALLTPYQPSVLRLIRLAVENGRKAGIWVSMCGEAASVQKLVPLWLGMGIQELSMNPPQILRTRELISRYRMDNLTHFVDETMAIGDAESVKDFLRTVKLQASQLAGEHCF